MIADKIKELTNTAIKDHTEFVWVGKEAEEYIRQWFSRNTLVLVDIDLGDIKIPFDSVYINLTQTRLQFSKDYAGDTAYDYCDVVDLEDYRNVLKKCRGIALRIRQNLSDRITYFEKNIEHHRMGLAQNEKTVASLKERLEELI